MADPCCTAGGALSGTDPGWVLAAAAVAWAAVAVLAVLLTRMCWPERPQAQTRRRARTRGRVRPRGAHAVPQGPVGAAVTVAEIQHRVQREAAEARKARARPPRTVQVVARQPVVPDDQS